MWPTPQDYNEALQNPQLVFRDAQLKTCLAEVDRLGLPRAVSGSFASVYHVQAGDKDLAVRCFLHHFADQQQRYASISQYLMNRNPASIVGFQFLNAGIRVHDQWFPLLKMDWVSGDNLIDWAKRHLDDRQSLHCVCTQFVELCSSLSRLGIAHGDLQHGNILVTDEGLLKLVDYDGMFVPALGGLGSHELGQRNYQHPQRSKQHFSAYLDNFSAWSIYTSLHCLARDPRLLDLIDGGDECLLFRQADYVHPDSSPAFLMLQQHDDESVRNAGAALRKLLSLPLEQLPALSELAAGQEASRQIDVQVPIQSNARPNARQPIPAMVAMPNPPRLVAQQAEDKSASVWAPPVVTQPSHSVSAPPNVTAEHQVKRLGSHMMSGKFEIGIFVFVAAILIASQAMRLNRHIPDRHLPPLASALPIATSLVGNSDFDAGIKLQDQRNYSAAIASYTRAMSSFAGQQNQAGMAACAYSIGACHYYLRQTDLCIEWLRTAAEKYRGEQYAPSLDADIGCIYVSAAELNRAIPFLERSLARGVNYSFLTGQVVSGTLKETALNLLEEKRLDALLPFEAAVLYEHRHGIGSLDQDSQALSGVASRLAQSKDPELAAPVDRLAKQLATRPPVLPNPRAH